ncbi:AraC family transcriptional regulator [Actinoplanes aureus]|uniref:AraC family transcriptional regulator n=1 Tax=Actinoplanes aureus TaxID=2792083 RepID=A0A931FZ94_9ACTN|nr:AraC family transcriptional regulator [Actinoplanes aureus]MBG0565453.1 AraC family transcriptional regulator [Actinoplanes aureus]
MDPLDEMLRGVRADGVVFGRSVLSPPWAVRFDGKAALTLCVPLSGGSVWILRDGDEARPVRFGESAVVRGPFTVADGVADPSPDPAADAPDSTVLLAGTYPLTGHAQRRLLRILPPVLVLPDDECGPLRGYLGQLEPGSGSGRQVVLDRLMEWILVCTLREWFDRPEAETPGWYRALSDDVVGPVLRAMHDAPAEPWTLATLADRAAVSRTTLAKRFAEVVGEPPLAYLTTWRMGIAADLLAEPGATVAAVARRVGYADAFSFSAAFKRVQGESPTGYRRRRALPSDFHAVVHLSGGQEVR